MKYSLALLLALLLSGVSFSAEALVQEPLLTITGNYRDTDGRVKEHKFPIEFKLSADGSLTGSMESWIEIELTNGSSHLSYFNVEVTGKWMIKDNAIHIIIGELPNFPQIAFEKINGLSIKIERKQTPNKPDTGAAPDPQR